MRGPAEGRPDYIGIPLCSDGSCLQSCVFIAADPARATIPDGDDRAPTLEERKR